MGLSDEIQTQIDHTLQQLPASQQGTIKKVYSDPTFVDIQLDTGIVNYVKCIGTAEVGAEAVLLFLNNSHNEYIVITQTNIDENTLERIIEEIIGDEIDLSNYYTKEEIDEIIAGGGADLKNYVKKSELLNNYDVDLDFSFGMSGFDDTISIDTAIIEKLTGRKQININGD